MKLAEKVNEELSKSNQDPNLKIGKYLTLKDLSTGTKTYKANKDRIAPYPKEFGSIVSLQGLARNVIDPIIDHYGKENFILTYGFSSADLSKVLQQKDNEGKKNGVSTPVLDQHAALEKNKRGNFINKIKGGGSAIDFRIKGVPSDEVRDWIKNSDINFDSLYFYQKNAPLHISHNLTTNKRVLRKVFLKPR